MSTLHIGIVCDGVEVTCGQALRQSSNMGHSGPAGCRCRLLKRDQPLLFDRQGVAKHG